MGDAAEPAGVRGVRLRHGRLLPALLLAAGALRHLHDQLQPTLQLKPRTPRTLLPHLLVTYKEHLVTLVIFGNIYLVT